MRNEEGCLTLNITRRLSPAKLDLFARSRRLGNYLLNPPMPLPSNHQMQINKSGGIILAITWRKMTKIKLRRHSWCLNPRGGTVQSIFYVRYSICKFVEEMKTMLPTGLRIRSTMSQSVVVFEIRTVFAK